MSANLKAYEQQQFAKHHYRQLISAKSTLTHLHSSKPSSSSILPFSHSLTPLDRYEHTTANQNIRNKLKAIYETKPPRVNRRKKKQKRQSQPNRSYSLKHQEKVRQEENTKMYEKIITARSTIGDFKQREKELEKYAKMTRKKIHQPDDCLFHAFRELLLETRTTTKRPLSNSSARRSLKSQTIAHYAVPSQDSIRQTC